MLARKGNCSLRRVWGKVMTEIREEVFVKCPPQKAQTYIVQYLKSLGSEGGASRLKLTATVGSEEGTQVTLVHEAIAVFEPLSSATLEYKVLIHWTPTGNEPLPRFDGAFHVQWDEEYGNSRLVIEGRYEPPLGVVGKVFDAAAGQKIARNTMAALLRNLRDAIASAYQKDMSKTQR